MSDYAPRIFVFWVGNETVYVRGEDTNDAWGKIDFDGSCVDSMTQAEFEERFARPEVMD